MLVIASNIFKSFFSTKMQTDFFFNNLYYTRNACRGEKRYYSQITLDYISQKSQTSLHISHISYWTKKYHDTYLTEFTNITPHISHWHHKLHVSQKSQTSLHISYWTHEHHYTNLTEFTDIITSILLNIQTSLHISSWIHKQQLSKRILRAVNVQNCILIESKIILTPVYFCT